MRRVIGQSGRVSPSVLRRQILNSFATLASAVPLLRPGAPQPGSAPPLRGAPLEGRVGRLGAERSQLRRSLRASVAEGMVAEVFTACAGATVLTGWAVALKLGPFLVGVMSALPFCAQFVQFPAAWLTSLLGHRRVALGVVLLSRQVMLPLCLLPWLGLSLEGQRRLLVGVAATSAVLAVMGNNAWTAWMGELVPESLRGRYFGRRTAISTLSATLASLVAGVTMDRLHAPEGVGLGLPLLAGVSCVAGGVCTLLMLRQHDPAPQRERPRLDPRVALLPLRDERARRVLGYQLAWNAAVGLCTPFFAYHALKNLKLGFLALAVQAASTAAMRMVTAPLWGRIIDRRGAQPVLLVCSLGLCVLPLVWLWPTPDFLWPLLLDVVIAGGLWSGHTLASFALPLAVAPRDGRPFYLAAFSTAGGLTYTLASALGGALAGWLPGEFTLGGHAWCNLHVLFLLSALARGAAALLALRILEPRAEPVRSLGALVTLLRPRPLPAPALAEPHSTES